MSPFISAGDDMPPAQTPLAHQAPPVMPLWEASDARLLPSTPSAPRSAHPSTAALSGPSR